MPNGTYGGVRGRKTKVGRKLSFSSYSIVVRDYSVKITVWRMSWELAAADMT